MEKKNDSDKPVLSQHLLTGKDVQAVSSTLHPVTAYELQQKTGH